MGSIISIDIIRYLGKPKLEASVWELARKHGQDIVCEHLNQLLALSVNHSPPLFSIDAPETACYKTSFSEVTRRINTVLSSIAIGLTDSCNMACHYCIYSGKYEARSHRSNHIMSPKVLEDVLKYFIEHSTEKTDKLHCGFYGGEPTLCFELIRHATNFLDREMNDNRLYTIGITTNFLNISTEMLSFFRDHDFLVYVSLDGPKHIHDRYRVRQDGNGTFDQIVKNLRKLKEIDQEYYDRRVLLQTTLTPPYEMRELCEFFDNHDLVPRESGGVVPNFVETPENFIQNCISRFSNIESVFELQKEYLKQALLGRLQGAKNKRFIEKMFDRQFLDVYRRKRLNCSLPKSVFPGGICLPGQRKLYVRWDGTYFPCEKTPEYKSLIIGNHKRGVDVEKAYKLCQEFVAMTANDCTQCWAMLLCNSICFVHAFDDNGPAPEKKRKACEVLRKSKSELLSEMCSVLEKTPTAFDHLNEYVVS